MTRRPVILAYFAWITGCFSPTGSGSSSETTSDATTSDSGGTLTASSSDTGATSSTSSTSSTAQPDTSAATASSTGHACGDGVLDDGEECDDMGTDDGDGCSHSCMKEFRRVFITEAKTSGAIGGILGADMFCQSSADGVGLSGTFKAWLSTTVDFSPVNSFTRSLVPYVLVDGTQIATDWDDLVTGNLLAPILLTEHGDPPPPPSDHPCIPANIFVVWTNTLATGNVAYADKSCADWTEDAQGEGYVGRADSLQSSWSQGCPVPCSTMAPLYCFEQ